MWTKIQSSCDLLPLEESVGYKVCWLTKMSSSVWREALNMSGEERTVATRNMRGRSNHAPTSPTCTVTCILGLYRNNWSLIWTVFFLQKRWGAKLNYCKRLKLLTNIVINFFIIQQNKFFSTQCKLIINNVEIIACKLELFKNLIIYFINQRISAEREISIAIVSAP